jgi:hypothetical protein
METRNIGRKHVIGELDTFEVQVEELGKRDRDESLPHPWYPLQEYMPSG